MVVQALGGGDRRVIGEKMIIPIRCFTCGALIGDKWEEFSRRVKNGENPGKVLDDLGVKRYCCRRMLLSHIELIDEILVFSSCQIKKEED
mgnify:CR=1 FL=1